MSHYDIASGHSNPTKAYIPKEIMLNPKPPPLIRKLNITEPYIEIKLKLITCLSVAVNYITPFLGCIRLKLPKLLRTKKTRPTYGTTHLVRGTVWTPAPAQSLPNRKSQAYEKSLLYSVFNTSVFVINISF